MYSNKFVVAVKYDGRILREQKDVVNLPFGSEYSLLLKNKESKGAVVSVEIDGKDVLDGTTLFIPSNQEIELTGFLNKSKSSVTNKFKFIQKTQKIIDHRGDFLDDGLIKVTFTFEQDLPEVKTAIWYHQIPYQRYYGWDNWYPPYSPIIWSSGRWTNLGDNYTSRGAPASTITSTSATYNCSVSSNMTVDSAPLQDEGITVKGSPTQQDFITTYARNLEQNSHTIFIKLRGRIGKEKEVTKVITTTEKLSCSTCGTKSRSISKFCHECGTSLI